MAAVDDLLANIFDGLQPGLMGVFRPEFATWVRDSRRFREFAGGNRSKIRAKLKSARDEGGLLDVRAELQTAVEGTVLRGDPALLTREVLDVLVAGMTADHVLERLTEGVAVVTPGDRSDVLLGVLLAHHSRTFPSLAGIVLNGGLPIDPQIHTIVEGLKLSLPVIEVGLGTSDTARVLGAVTGRITRTSERKIQTAIALVDEVIDGTKLLREIQIAPTEVVTPVMFEHRLIDRARRADRHIVLPEGEEDRILIAADQLLRPR